MILNCRLLHLSGLDTVENLEIYETYMRFGQYSYNCKKSYDLIPSNLKLIQLDITDFF